MKKYRFVSFLILALLCLMLIAGFINIRILPVQAIYGSSDHFYEVTGLSFTPSAVDVDSEGRIFCASTGQDVWRSTDGGVSWTKVLDKTGTGTVMMLFVDSRDYIFVPFYLEGTMKLFRSTDHGDSWSQVASAGILWHWGEMSNGTLLINYYSDNSPYVIKSTDAGATWSIWFNATKEGYDCKHVHVVRVNPFNDDVWVGTGDGLGKSHVLRYRNDTCSWEEVAKLQPTDFMFDSNYVYIVPDAAYNMYRIPHRGSFSNEYVWHAGFSGDNSGNFGYWGNKIENEDIYLMGTRMGQLWASWDCNHWIKVFEAQDNCIDHISTRKPIFFVDRTAGKLYHLTMTSYDIKILYNEELRGIRGGIHDVGSSTTVIEQVIPNGKSYIDLEEAVVTNPQAAVKGYSRYNLLSNSGWEWGNTTGWSFAGTATTYLVTSEKYEGSYSLAVEKRSTLGGNRVYQNPPSNMRLIVNKGDIVVASGYFKTNTTSIPSNNKTLQIGIYSLNKSVWLAGPQYYVNNTWQRFSAVAHSDRDNHHLTILYAFKPSNVVNFTMYFDAGLVQVMPEYIADCAFDQTEEQRAIQYFDASNPWAFPSSYFNTELKTSNPSLTVNGETVSHSGTLDNGTSSSATSLSTLSGVITVEANIQGSQLATLRINGTTHTKISNGHIFNYHNSIPYGVYYGTPTIASSNFVILADKKSWIVADSQVFSNDKLTFQVSGASGYSGTVKVYCGDKGEPTSVTEVDSWSYDNLTNIVTLTKTYSGPASPAYVTLDWPKSVRAQIQELIETVETWNLPKGTENSFTSKLDEAIQLLNKGNENGAIHKLMDFINQVERLKEKKLTTEKADYLIAEAQRIIDLIEG